MLRAAVVAADGRQWGTETVSVDEAQRRWGAPDGDAGPLLTVEVAHCALSEHDVCEPVAGAVPGYEVAGTTGGREVVGLLPVSTRWGGCATQTVQPEALFVDRPAGVAAADAVACLQPGLRAFTALHYQAHLVAGEVVLIANGASAAGHLAVQLASVLGARVLTTASSPEEVNYLQGIGTEIVRIIDTAYESVVDAVMEETGGLGVDVLVENRMDAREARSEAPGLDPADATRCLAAQGRWVTCARGLQLDPPVARILSSKGASLCFLWDPVWLLAGDQLGRYRHIVTRIMELLAEGRLQPNISNRFSLDRAPVALRCLETSCVGRVVIDV